MALYVVVYTIHVVILCRSSSQSNWFGLLLAFNVDVCFGKSSAESAETCVSRNTTIRLNMSCLQFACFTNWRYISKPDTLHYKK